MGPKDVSITVNAGRQMVLPCRGTGNPTPRVTWSKTNGCGVLGNFTGIMFVLQNTERICLTNEKALQCLTHICPVDYSILINWTSPFPVLGVSGVLFHLYLIFDRNSCKQTV